MITYPNPNINNYMKTLINLSSSIKTKLFKSGIFDNACFHEIQYFIPNRLALNTIIRQNDIIISLSYKDIQNFHMIMEDAMNIVSNYILSKTEKFYSMLTEVEKSVLPTIVRRLFFIEYLPNSFIIRI